MIALLPWPVLLGKIAVSFLIAAMWFGAAVGIGQFLGWATKDK